MEHGTLIDIKEIKCPKILENISDCSEGIKKFLALIDSQLPENKRLSNNQVFFIIRADDTAYENDGNTHCDGYRYKIFWAFPLHFVTDFNPDDFIFFEDDAQNLLYVCLEEEERIHDHRGRRIGLKIHIAGNPDEEGHSSRRQTRIDYNNENFSLLSILTQTNAIRCVFKIRELYEWNLIKESMSNVQQQDAQG